jgi:hypothetical protein
MCTVLQRARRFEEKARGPPHPCHRRRGGRGQVRGLTQTVSSARRACHDTSRVTQTIRAQPQPPRGGHRGHGGCLPCGGAGGGVVRAWPARPTFPPACPPALLTARSGAATTTRCVRACGCPRERPWAHSAAARADRTNVLGTRNVVDVCLERNVGKLVCVCVRACVCVSRGGQQRISVLLLPCLSSSLPDPHVDERRVGDVG